MTDEKQKAERKKEIDDAEWRLLEEGVRDELEAIPAKRIAVRQALERRKEGSLFPETELLSKAELEQLAWLEQREIDLKAGLQKLQTESRELHKEEQARHPVLWRVHFAGVFRERGGFDIVILNPPYVSVQGASKLAYVRSLTQKLGFNADHYAFFAYRAFGLPERHFPGIARPSGVICFITSDTYFTLQSELRMRQLLQEKDLRLLVQCDPFKQTVDTAIFLALNRPASQDGSLEFIQARRVLDHFPSIPFEPEWKPGAEFELPVSDGERFACDIEQEDDGIEPDEPTAAEVLGCEHDGLRRYRVPVAVYRNALKRSFFEPSMRNAALYNRFMAPIKELVETWWDKIETSAKFEKNRKQIEQYHQGLQPGDITLVGLICEGGQGMRTANNGRFLGYLEGTPQAQAVLMRVKQLESEWASHPSVGPHYRRLKQRSLDIAEVVDALKERFPGDQNWTKVLGLHRGEVYRIVPAELVHEVSDLKEPDRKKLVAEGISGKRCWVPFRKGDPEGNRWVSFEPLYICWSRENVNWLSDRHNPLPRWQGYNFFFTEGITWTAVANHVPLKARIQPKCVFDADSMRLTPVQGTVSALFFLAVLNSDAVSYVKWRFIKGTQKYEIGDLRLIPIVVPTFEQHCHLEQLATSAIRIQTDILQKGRAARQSELDRIQVEVDEAVEELYGVRGLGPFNEF
jgi:hypothetical protein